MGDRDRTDGERIRSELGSRLDLGPLLEAASGARLYLVGGAVRDALLDRPLADIDLVVEGDALAIARRLDSPVRSHDRFGTTTVRLGEATVDLVGARSERYERPGALPIVRPGDLGEDLRRRDFTINAMAVPLDASAGLIDPHGGRADLERCLIRVLHEGSFADDPTRALRAARYAVRLGFGLEPGTAALLAAADLSTVSDDRVRSELARIALEPDPAPAFELIRRWGLIGLEPAAIERAARVVELLSRDRWRSLGCDRAGAVLGALLAEPDQSAERLAASAPGGAYAAVAAARGAGPETLLIARALGAGWLDDYLDRWRGVGLEITGRDLIAAGLEPGPGIGRGLEAALEAKLDRGVAGREAELRVALAAAREDP